MPPKSGSEPAAGSNSPQRPQAGNTSARINVAGAGGPSTSASTSQFNRSRSRSPSASPQFGSRRVASPAGIAFGTLPTIPSATALNITGLSESAGLGTSRIRIGNHNNGSNADLLGHDSDSLSISSSPRSSHSFFNSGNATQQGEGIGNKGRSGSLVPGGSMSIAIGTSASNSAGSTPSGSIAIRSATLAYPDPIGSGSPREQRLYERGNTTPSTATANAFSSSFPNSSIWLQEKPAALASSPTTAATSSIPTTAPRNLLSRHLSMSGNASRSESLSRASGSASGWPGSVQSNADDSLSGLDTAREGRSRTRNLLASSIAGPASKGSSPGHDDGSGSLSRSLSIASGRGDLAGHSAGIAASNMSPFVRDVNQLPFVAPNTANPMNTGRNLASIGPGAASTASRQNTGSMLGQLERAGERQSGSIAAGQYSASYTASRDFFPQSRGLTGRPNYAIEKPFGMGDFSLGAVGSGRRRRDSYWGSERSLREGDEDLDFTAIGREGFGSNMATSFSEDDEDEDYAPPTRSGATSRRHSVAAFTSSSTLTSLTGLSSPPPRSQIGFHLPGDALTMSSSSTSRRNPNQALIHGRSASSTFASHLGEGGSSRLDDEDLLATDLSNALQLNLDAQAAKDRSAQNEMLSPRIALSGLQSQASSLPIHSSNNFLQDSSGSSPYSSASMAIGGNRASQQGVSARQGGEMSTSPPRARSQRASSTSGDPYSPSASAARFLATAQHVQPPALQPQQVAQLQHGQQQQMGQGEGQRAASPNMWPQQAAGLFSEGSPYARSGTLPPPEYLANYGGNTGMPQSANTKPTNTHLPSTFNPSTQPFGFNNQELPYGNPASVAGLGQVQHQANHPAHFSLNQTQIAPARTGPMPPFAGFAGMNAQQYHHSGPTQTISHLNAHAQPYYVAPIAPQPSLNDLGRGVPLHALPSGGPLYIIEFKAGRTDLFYIDDPNHLVLQKGDLVVVEADRGKDLGKCLTSCTLDEVREFQMHQVESALGQLAANAGGGPTIGGVTPVPLAPGQQPTAAVIARMTKEIHPKKIYGRASPADVALLAVKAQDEAKALNVCRAKVVQHQLPMEVTDAEFQFDRRRLTFFYIADRRIDFRNLVKDLFRLYKTRIWLCAVEGGQIQSPQAGQMSGYAMSSDT